MRRQRRTRTHVDGELSQIRVELTGELEAAVQNRISSTSSFKERKTLFSPSDTS